ncbi:chitin synthase, class 5 [Zygosaccharomyces mellis]|uniref:Chitin biosynthesis protein CHS5 n=1 Tax=Zygosaccharomyces mellis TaxID=42258 RepID=A0A4C2E2E1_9SACH|nr:chitin synthase, class 5 [Zygosaccharomyces mellis]
MSDVEVLLTVGKLDASLALLTTQDHHVIEFPTMLLPDHVKAGSIVKLCVSQNLEEEKRQRRLFKDIQMKILEKYGTQRPKAPVLKIVNVTQTSCVLAWDPLSLGSARLKSLILYRQGIRSMVIPSPLKTTTTKISGLSVDTDYEFQLKLSTTSGQYWSEKIRMHTHKMTDMTGITVCLGPLDPLQKVSDEQIAYSLQKIGARPMQKHAAIDTTHFVTNEIDNEDDPELARAKSSNIPIVRPEWVRACEIERRIVGVRGFYLDADPGILKSYQFPKINASKVKFADKAETLGDKKEEETEKETEKVRGEEHTKREGDEIREQEAKMEVTGAKRDLNEKDKPKQGGEAATETLAEVKDDVVQSEQDVSGGKNEEGSAQVSGSEDKETRETKPEADRKIQDSEDSSVTQVENAHLEPGEPKEAAFEEKVDASKEKKVANPEEVEEGIIAAEPDTNEDVPAVAQGGATIEAKPEEANDGIVEHKEEASKASEEKSESTDTEAVEAAEKKPGGMNAETNETLEGKSDDTKIEADATQIQEPKTEVISESRADESAKETESETPEIQPSETQENVDSSHPKAESQEPTSEPTSNNQDLTPTPGTGGGSGSSSGSSKKNKKKNKNKKK